MQVVALDRDSGRERRKPSARLQEKIRNCVSVFRSLNETVNEVIEIGKSEGFTPLEIGQFIRNEMLKAGLHRSTAARYLPAELKNKPRGKQVATTTAAAAVSRKLRQNQNPSLTSQKQAKTLTFEATITTNQDKRKIAIPAQYRQEVDKHFLRP